MTALILNVPIRVAPPSWAVSAIARHLGRDRKTIRAYVAGHGAGVRVHTVANPFEPFAAYCGQRLKMIRICGPRRCSTSCSSWVTAVASDDDPADPPQGPAAAV